VASVREPVVVEHSNTVVCSFWMTDPPVAVLYVNWMSVYNVLF